jgi:hypothetical protein
VFYDEKVALSSITTACVHEGVVTPEFATSPAGTRYLAELLVSSADFGKVSDNNTANGKI